VDTLRLVDTQQTATGAPAEAVGCTCGVRLCAAVGTTTIPAVTVALTPILRCVFGHPTSGCAPGNPAASASGEPRGRRQGCVPGRGSWTPTKAARGHPFSAFLDTHSTPRSALGIRTQSCSDRSSTACSLHVLEFQEFRTRTEGVHGHHKVHEFRTPSQVVHGHHRVKRVSIEAPADLPRGCVPSGGQRTRTWRAAHVHEWHVHEWHALGPYASVGVHASSPSVGLSTHRPRIARLGCPLASAPWVSASERVGCPRIANRAGFVPRPARIMSWVRPSRNHGAGSL
jgi:hypothetical protein